MLEAIVERLGDRVKLSAPPALLDYEVRARLGMYQTVHVHRFPRTSASLGGFLPPELRRRYGLAADRDITGVLDASGFAYSDSFGGKRSKREALYGRRWQSRGVPKVMLPQAFGPFEDRDVARWATEVLNQANIVFVRDATSRNYLKRLQIRTEVIVAPDFTIGLDPTIVDVPVGGQYVAIVPNTKLVTQRVIGEEAYVEGLTALARAAMSVGLIPLVVVHEASDRRIASTISSNLNARVFEDGRPRALKGAIGGASLLIASRFHAVVGGLSQAVPTIAIGWSHKYSELLRDFDVSDWVGRLDVDPRKVVSEVIGDDQGVARLKDAKLALTEKVNSMWDATEQVLAI